MSKAGLDLWLRDVSPSDGLRKWFSHDPKRWAGFKRKYAAELHKSGFLAKLKEVCRKKKVVTLLYAAKDEEHNNAVVLKGLLSR